MMGMGNLHFWMHYSSRVLAAAFLVTTCLTVLIMVNASCRKGGYDR